MTFHSKRQVVATPLVVRDTLMLNAQAVRGLNHIFDLSVNTRTLVARPFFYYIRYYNVI